LGNLQIYCCIIYILYTDIHDMCIYLYIQMYIDVLLHKNTICVCICVYQIYSVYMKQIAYATYTMKNDSGQIIATNHLTFHHLMFP
jgi:hypothetical protein